MAEIKKIEGILHGYPESIEGTKEWYCVPQTSDPFCDLYEAEEIYGVKGHYCGTTWHLLHAPEGKVYSPFACMENTYIVNPTYLQGKFYFLKVDFSGKTIQIHSYEPMGNVISEIAVLPLNTVKTCYNLFLKAYPLMLCQDTNENVLEVLWPERRTFPIGETEGFLFRDGENLYFSEWYENPEYHENIIVRDWKSGAVKEKREGYLYKLTDELYWEI